MTNCLIIQHVAPEPAFVIADALADAGITVDIRRVYAGERVPEGIDGFDGLVVMGGPMSAGSDQDFPTRREEIALIRAALADEVPFLGVCLGAQLLAAAGGSAIVRGESGPEVGWASVELSPSCRSDLLFADLPSALTVLHWHGETFDLPRGAHHLMGNRTYPNQAFRIGGVAWGLQFHLEVTEASVEGFLAAFGEEAQYALGGPAAIRSATPGALALLTPVRDLVLVRFTGLVVAHARTGDLVERP